MGFFGLIISIPATAAVKSLLEKYYFKEPPEDKAKAKPVEGHEGGEQEAA